MHSFITVSMLSAALAVAQSNPPPPEETLTATKSGALPVLPPGFTGVPTLEGAIVQQAPPNASYVGPGGPAKAQSNLPAATYTATFPSVAFDELTGTVISGTVTGSSTAGGSGVSFSINLSNLPNLSQYGPFLYHIHDMPVPSDGNCTSTMGHFDVTNAGEYYMCDTSLPQNCQTGDLAGKHGKVTTAPTFSASYNEPYLSTDPSSPYFFGSRSIVIHSMNTTRLTCANFVLSSPGSSSGSGTNGTSSNGTAPNPIAPPAGTPPVATGAGNKAVAGGVLAVVGAFAALLM